MKRADGPYLTQVLCGLMRHLSLVSLGDIQRQDWARNLSLVLRHQWEKSVLGAPFRRSGPQFRASGSFRLTRILSNYRSDILKLGSFRLEIRVFLRHSSDKRGQQICRCRRQRRK